MNRRLARAYAHDVVLRGIDHVLEDDEWLSCRLTPEELGLVLSEVKALRQRHIEKFVNLPQPRPAAGEENVCEHGDHPAPAGKRFCSRACQECEATDHDARKTECAGVCLRC